MIKIEHIITPSPEQMEFVIEGMRNPMNSWEKSDSYKTHIEDPDTLETADFAFFTGDADENLMKKLCKAGIEHRKFMRMMPVMMRIQAPIYFYKELDTYRFCVRNSTSTMHKLTSKEITLDDFSIDEEMYCFKEVISHCEKIRKLYVETKDPSYWRMLIQLLPESYNQTSNMYFNYEILANMYHQRKNHKLTEWHEFCNVLENLPYSFLITGEANE